MFLTSARRSSLLPTSLREVASLAASWTPGALFACGLFAIHTDPRFEWVSDLGRYPWQLFAIAIGGGVATMAGTWDWFHHRSNAVVVGALERKVELLALAGGGVPLFILMATASVTSDPRPFLVPVVIALVATTVLVTYDEVRFHRRRCSAFEHALHRTLTFGHLFALLAWMHLVFVTGLDA
jgi:hypothetical protein